MPTGEVVAHEHTPESLLRHLGRAESLGEEASAADAAFRDGLTGPALAEQFPAQPSSACRWCDFLRVCPEGSAQHSPAQPWDALAD